MKSHRPRKHFGQNFLIDTSIIQHIISVISPHISDSMVEIGPGLGALTFPLLKHLNHLKVIEIDTDLAEYLENQPFSSLQVIQQDVLTFDFTQLGSHLRVVGNLPYNISSPLILHLLQFNNILDMHFMLQKEVVERLAAEPNSKSYGRLSIITQYFCEVEYLFTVPPEAFNPKPKVDSAIIRLVPYTQSPYPKVDVLLLQKIVAQAFNMRRKTLANNLKPLLSSETLHSLDIDPQKRPEQISISEYIKITQYLDHNIPILS